MTMERGKAQGKMEVLLRIMGLELHITNSNRHQELPLVEVAGHKRSKRILEGPQVRQLLLRRISCSVRSLIIVRTQALTGGKKLVITVGQFHKMFNQG